MSQPRHAYVYILASRKNGTLYVGVTSDLRTRLWQHEAGAIAGFTKQHKVNTLVYQEKIHSVRTAIDREKTIKGWNRARKIALIESTNPDWDDLASTWFERRLGSFASFRMTVSVI